MALATLAGPAPAVASGDLVVAARETKAAVAPRGADLKLVNLPPLEFGLRAAFRCKGEPVSLTLSIADTYTTLRGEALADERAVELELTVPADQLALAASSGFCVADDPETTDELLVTGFATANASLRCAGDPGHSVHFASAPLQVRLVCTRSPADVQEPPEASADR